MNVNTIKMNQAEARQAYEHYRAAVRLRHNDEDKAIMNGYRSLAQGKILIDVRAAISQAGVDNQFRPHLAIARADALEYESKSHRSHRAPSIPSSGFA